MSDDQEAWVPTGRVRRFAGPEEENEPVLQQEFRNIDGKTKWEDVPLVTED